MNLTKTGLTEKELDNMVGMIKRHTPLNGALLGKIKKIATMEQVVYLYKLEKEYPPNDFDPIIKLRRQIKRTLH